MSKVELSEAPKGFYVETVVTYKEDFVPITSRIVNYLKSWTGGPGPKSWLTAEFWKQDFSSAYKFDGYLDAHFLLVKRVYI